MSSPKTLAERCEVEGTCPTKLALRIPPSSTILRTLRKQSYTAWPDRLYVIDRDGRVAYKSKPGPFGFKPAEMEVALKKILPAAAAPPQISQAR